MIPRSGLSCDLGPAEGAPRPTDPDRSAPCTPTPRAPGWSDAGSRWRASPSDPGGVGAGLRGRGLRAASGRKGQRWRGGRLGASTLQEGAAPAVRGAPEPGRAVLAARQEALPVGAQAQPVDAPAVLGADPQGRPAAPHPAVGRGARRTRRLLRRGARAPALPAASSRSHRGGPGPRVSAEGTGHDGVKLGTLASAPPTRQPSPGTQWARRCVGGPLGTPVPPMGQFQPHRLGAPPFLTLPPKTRTPPERAPSGPGEQGRGASGRAGKPSSLRGAPAVRRTREDGHPKPRAPSPASTARSGRRSAEQYSPAWLLLRDHPPTCPLPLLRPALQTPPPARVPGDPPRPTHPAPEGMPPRATLRVAPAAPPGSRDGGGRRGRVRVGEARTPRNSLGRRLRASTWQVCSLQAPSPEDPTREALGGLGGGPLLESALDRPGWEVMRTPILKKSCGEGVEDRWPGRDADPGERAGVLPAEVRVPPCAPPTSPASFSGHPPSAPPLRGAHSARRAPRRTPTITAGTPTPERRAAGSY